MIAETISDDSSDMRVICAIPQFEIVVSITFLHYLIISHHTVTKKLCLYEQIFLVLSNDAPKIGYIV